MHVSLTPALEKMVREKTESGLYNNASEVIREALRLMIERDSGLEWLRQRAVLGFDQLDAGEYVELTHDQFRQRLKKKRRAA